MFFFKIACPAQGKGGGRCISAYGCPPAPDRDLHLGGPCQDQSLKLSSFYLAKIIFLYIGRGSRPICTRPTILFHTCFSALQQGSKIITHQKLRQIISSCWDCVTGGPPMGTLDQRRRDQEGPRSTLTHGWSSEPRSCTDLSQDSLTHTWKGVPCVCDAPGVRRWEREVFLGKWGFGNPMKVTQDM